MALSDDFQDRYSTTYVKQITNPDTPNPSSVNTTTLDAAVTDVKSEFTRRGITYDSTEDSHVATACLGIEALLLLRGGKSREFALNRYDEFKEQIEIVRKSGPADRFAPKTNSVITPTAEDSGGRTVRPDFDLPAFDNMTPRRPRSHGSSDDT